MAFVSGSHAQSRSGVAATPIEPGHVEEVAPHFYVISNPAVNLVLVTRDDTSFVAGVQRPELVSQALATLKELKAPDLLMTQVCKSDRKIEDVSAGWNAAMIEKGWR